MISGLQIPFDLQNLLKDWGVTFTVLAIAAASFLVLLFFSAREFISWFTRASKILKVQREILTRLELLERSNEKQMSLLKEKIETAAESKKTGPTQSQSQSPTPQSSAFVPTAPLVAPPIHRFPLGPQASEKPASFLID